MRALYGLLAASALGVSVTWFTKPRPEAELKGLVAGTQKDAMRQFKGSEPNRRPVREYQASDKGTTQQPGFNGWSFPGNLPESTPGDHHQMDQSARGTEVSARGIQRQFWPARPFRRLLETGSQLQIELLPGRKLLLVFQGVWWQNEGCFADDQV